MGLSQKAFEEIKRQAGMNVAIDNSGGRLVWYEDRIQYRQLDTDKAVVAELIPMRRFDVLALVAEAEINRTELERLQAENAALREKMAWLGKGKMRPMERRYQAFLQQEATDGFDDTPLDYVQWLESELTWREELATRAAGTAKKPDAAPVEPPAREIAVGDSVRVTLEGIRKGHVGTVTRLPEDNYGAYEVKLAHLLDIFETALLDYSRDEIEPA